MTKLPPIYLPLFGSGLDTFTLSSDEIETAVAYTRRADAVLQHSTEQIVEYEPAVPRCKTCDSFAFYCDDDSQADDRHYCKRGHFNELPGDGSGYCHEHQEAKR